MNSYVAAREVYEREPSVGTFEDAVFAHALAHNLLFIRPDVFLMGRPVPKEAPHALILDPWHRFSSEDCNAWFVWMASGNLAKTLDFVPFPLEWVGWQKRNRLRWHRLADIRAKVFGP